MRHRAFIGLGANLPSPRGAPETTVRAAMAELADAGRVVKRSSLYRTEPVGVEQQPVFVNAVAEIETELEPEALLEFLLAVERHYGRERRREAPKGPRTLDLDLLLVDGLVMRKPGLIVPHPEMEKRRFVLAPLAEIAPDIVHPVLGKTIAELLAAMADEGPNQRKNVRKIEPEPSMQ